METVAEGLATAGGYEMPQGILWDLLYDFILVSDTALLQAIGILIEKAHTLAEAAGAAGLAGAIKCKDSIRGKKVAIVVSGGNLTPAQLGQALETYAPV